MSVGWVLLIVLLTASLSFLAGIAAVLWWAVPRIEKMYIFRPSGEVAKTPSDMGVPFEQHFIETPDGCRLSAWHLQPSDPLGAVVYFHGNGANLGILNEILINFHQAGLQVLAVDYRGYGWSSGTPSEEGLCVDAETAVRYFRDHLKAPKVPLIYWGRSLGCAFASYAARKLPPQGLILETPFPSKASLLRHYPQYRFFGLFSRVRLATAKHLHNHSFPVLVIHGDQDRTVPLEQGHLLYQKLDGPKEFFRVEGADHINLHLVDSEGYMNRVLSFVQQAKPPTVH
ncbi:MAG TPA: alpha/beta hydrolase [Acidobacteriota bacterium]|nr:alpha/beta hydrolase [Acidobacteriota bacterium]